MTLIEIFLIAVGVSMDAFAVAMGTGTYKADTRLDFQNNIPHRFIPVFNACCRMAYRKNGRILCNFCRPLLIGLKILLTDTLGILKFENQKGG